MTGPEVKKSQAEYHLKDPFNGDLNNTVDPTKIPPDAHPYVVEEHEGVHYNFEVRGYLYHRNDPDQSFIPRFAKPGDVGLDIPVKINIDEVKFGHGYPSPDKMRTPMLYPELKHYIWPNGGAPREDGSGETEARPCLEVPAMGWAEIPSGLCMKLPDDAWGYLKSRSSTTWRKHLVIIGSTIDPGYTGQLGTLVYNPNQKPVRVYEYDPQTRLGDCLAQLILIPVYPVKGIISVPVLPGTHRGKTGFGSSSQQG